MVAAPADSMGATFAMVSAATTSTAGEDSSAVASGTTAVLGGLSRRASAIPIDENEGLVPDLRLVRITRLIGDSNVWMVLALEQPQ